MVECLFFCNRSKCAIGLVEYCFSMQNVASVVVDLIQCTNEPNVSIPQLANLMIERTQHLSWVVVFKSLISLHHLMNYGNEVGSSGRLLLSLLLELCPTCLP